MNDLKPIFDLEKLEDHEVGHLMWVLNSPSYETVFKPYLEKRRNDLNRLLLDPNPRRRREYSDDFLRGGIIVIDGLLHFFERLISETEIERIARSQQAFTNEEKYEDLRQEGQVHPMNTVHEEYDPDEDF